MPISNYPNGFNNGVAIRNMPVLNSYSGNVYWVDSVNGSNQYRGTFARPWASLAYAYSSDKITSGDIVVLKAGHVETISAAAGVAADIAGTAVLFLGEGSARAQIQFGTATGADIDISAANITFVNPLFVAAIDALTGPIDVNAADFTIVNGEYRDAASIDTTDALVADANADRLTITGWKYVRGDEGGTQKQSNIQIAAASDVRLSNIDIVGDFATGAIENGTAWVDAGLENIVINNTNASPTVAVLMQATSSGWFRNSSLRVASGTTYVTATTDMQYDNVNGTGTDNTSASPVIAPVSVDATTAAALGTDGTTVTDSATSVLGAVGANNSNNAFDSSSVAANNDGSVLERLEYVATPPGSELVVQKTLTSSAIVQAGVDITAVSSGELILEDIFLDTDSTGLAAGTNFTIETSGSLGLSVFLSEAVANLGGNQTVVAENASVIPFYGREWASGTKLIAKCTSADCTGSGTIKVTMKFRRVDQGASIAAA